MTNNQDNEKIAQALVVSATRRYAELLLPNDSVVRGKLLPKVKEVAVGDIALYHVDDNHHLVEDVQPRRNLLRRNYNKVEKNLVANVDKLFIVTAVVPLFNTIFIDRMLAAAHAEGISASIILNKIDLDLTETNDLVSTYRELGLEIITLSAKFNLTMENIIDVLNEESLKIAVLAGLSGVGKSTILNQLVPDADRDTNEVSARTGQGRQTTSQAFGYLYAREKHDDLLLVDLPGLQRFGVSHLSEKDVRESFHEFSAYASGCEYADCKHLAEEKCSVKKALELGDIADTRYNSYCDMLRELENAREY